MAETDYWSAGITGVIGLAGSGLLGHKIQSIVQPNPPTAISRPAAAPTPAPVEGQMAVNPGSAPTVEGHLKRNWGKYLIGAGVLVAVVVGVKFLRK